jgi:CO/xanthine dehydrogenase FAD-binding subunit
VTTFSPGSVADAVAVLAEHRPVVLAGCTDYMVEVNGRHRRPGDVMSLRRLADVRRWSVAAGVLHLGAAVTFTELMRQPLAGFVPSLSQAARTVGSPQIRNMATIGGNVMTASPAGDSLVVLVALDAVVLLASVRGIRRLPVRELLTGPKRTAASPDELLLRLEIPLRPGRHEFIKVGARNAMVIAVASLALVVDRDRTRASCALGAVGPTVLRATAAEEFYATSGGGPWRGQLAEFAAEFASLVGAAAQPINDHRGTARYRRHCIEVCARRALQRSLSSGVER